MLFPDNVTLKKKPALKQDVAFENSDIKITKAKHACIL